LKFQIWVHYLSEMCLWLSLPGVGRKYCPVCRVKCGFACSVELGDAKSQDSRYNEKSHFAESGLFKIASYRRVLEMVEELLCPDCGGVVGATQTTAAGPPCSCFAGMATTTTAKSSGDTDTDMPVAPVLPQKICVICGKDVAGHRRIRETRGYLCLDCAKEEEKRDANGRVRCKVCGRMVKDEVMEAYEGTKMCPKCHRERVDMQKTKIKRIGIRTARTREELRTLYTLAGIGGFLLLIILLSLLHVLPRIF
jgi:hypothetical protein